MQRKLWIPLLSIVLVLPALACSLTDLFVSVQPPAPTLVEIPPSPTAVDTPTLTPVLATSTFTLTPTLIGWHPTETATVTGTPPPTESPAETPTEEQNIILMPKESGFTSVLISEPQIYYGNCVLKETTVAVRVNEPERVRLVSLFLRLRSKSTGNDSGWDIGTTMETVEEGLFKLTLNADDIHQQAQFEAFPDAFMEFQLIAFDKNIKEVGRSQKIVDQITISPCP